jgi:hypothetical protein
MLAAALTACTVITGDPNRIVAIDLLSPVMPRLEEGNTLQLEVRVLDAEGDVVPDPPVTWVVLDTGQVGFTIQEQGGLITAAAPGAGRVQARVEELRSGVISVTVTPAPDSLAAPGDVRLVVPTADPTSPPLVTLVFDLTTTPGEMLALAGKVVRYTTVEPASGEPAAAGFALVGGEDPHVVDATTGANGEASVTVEVADPAALPDSAIIDATAVTAMGTEVSGSPVRFIVVFEADN